MDDRPRDSHDLIVNAAGQATLTAYIRMGATLQLAGYAEPTDGARVASTSESRCSDTNGVAVCG